MGFCQSAESKTAAAHGDNGNHAQMNFLEFSAPSLVQERLDADGRCAASAKCTVVYRAHTRHNPTLPTRLWRAAPKCTGVLCSVDMTSGYGPWSMASS